MSTRTVRLLTSNTTYRYRVQAVDQAGNVSASSNTASATTPNPPDTTAPIISLVSAIPSVTRDNTPSFSITSTEPGTASYTGDCTGTTTVTSGTTTLTLNSLPRGLHSNCTLRVTDPAGNASNILSLSAFTVTYQSDLNQDKTVNLFDFNILKQHYGTGNARAM